MKKKTLAMLLTAALAASITAGCGSKEKETEPPKTEAATEVITEEKTEEETDAATEAVTEAATEVTTEAATEETTETATEIATEANSETITEKVTEAAADAEEESTEKATEKIADASADSEDETSAEEGTEATSEKHTEKVTETTVETTKEEITEAVTEEWAEIETEAVTEMATEAVTEMATEAVTEMATEAVAEITTQSETEFATETVTEEAAEIVTEKVTEIATEAVTEELTEEVTEIATEAVTEEVTEKETEAITEMAATEEETEETTEAATEEITEVVTEEATEATTEETTEAATEDATEAAAEEATETATEAATEITAELYEGDFTIGISQFAEHGSLDNCREGFLIGLADAGFVEGENLTVEYDNSQADTGIAGQIAESYVNDGVDLICAIATPSAMSAYNAALKTDIPVIYTAVSDPVAAGLANEDGTSTGNATGTSDKLPVEEQLKMIREILPDAEKIGIIYTTSEANSVSTIEEYKEKAGDYGFEIVESGINTIADVDLAAADIVGKVDCLSNMTDNTVVSALQTVLAYARDAKIPVFGSEVEQVKNGCLASMGIDYVALGEQTGAMAARILKGEATAQEIDFEICEGASLYVNTEVAENLGIEFEEDYLANAAEIFEKIIVE